MMMMMKALWLRLVVVQPPTAALGLRGRSRAAMQAEAEQGGKVGRRSAAAKQSGQAGRQCGPAVQASHASQCCRPTKQAEGAPQPRAAARLHLCARAGAAHAGQRQLGDG